MSLYVRGPKNAGADHTDAAPRSRRVDVAVLGGGPSGTAAAITLVRAGYLVTVFERSSYEAFRIGETFPPEVREPLIELGAWQEFLTQGYVESPGVAVAWGRAVLYDNDYILNAYGPGWHVDRRAALRDASPELCAPRASSFSRGPGPPCVLGTARPGGR